MLIVQCLTRSQISLAFIMQLNNTTVFLIQMSLDTKKQEIKKLEARAHMKEEALRRSEMMLEEDAMRFGT
jgi:hypothetical protein